MYCPCCGQENSSNFKFCIYCGAHLYINMSSNDLHTSIINSPFCNEPFTEVITSSFDVHPDTAASLHINETLKDGLYQIIDLLGMGGEGDVGLALRTDTLSLFAIKGHMKSLDNHALEEAKLLSKLDHPSIPIVYDYFTESDRFYIVQEYIAGQNLSQYVRTYGPLPETAILPIALKLCDVLQYLNSKSIIHGDVKPSNIILSDNANDIHLIDFGSATQTENNENTVMLGTRIFAAPEVLDKKTILPQSDIYSFGIVLFYLCTGEADISKLDHYTNNITVGLRYVISKCTKVNSSDRYQNYSALHSDLSLLSLGRFPNKDATDHPSKDFTATPHPTENKLPRIKHSVTHATSGYYPDTSMHFDSILDSSSNPTGNPDIYGFASPRPRISYRRRAYEKRFVRTILIGIVVLVHILLVTVCLIRIFKPMFLGSATGLPATIASLVLVSVIMDSIVYFSRSPKDSKQLSFKTPLTDESPFKTVSEEQHSADEPSVIDHSAEEVSSEPVKVFISYKQNVNGTIPVDYYMAQDLYNELTKRGIKAFFSKASMQKSGDSSFEAAIHDALEKSVIFVAVGSNKDFMNSPWVRYERETFHALMMNGLKGCNAGFYSYITHDFPVRDLPTMLSSFNSFTDVKELVDVIENRISERYRSSMTSEEERRKQNAQRVDRDIIPGCMISSRYQLLEQKKVGSYYKLFEAQDRKEGVKRLIKIINRYTIPDDFHDPEAGLLNSISCHGIPKIYEYRDTEPDYIYTVMDYYTGINLEVLHRAMGRLDKVHLLQWIINLCSILSVLHEQNGGFVHCNVKPSNIFIGENGDLNLINFSSACKCLSSVSVNHEARAISMMYAAPEQLLTGSLLDVRTDIYAVGCTMLTLLTDVSRVFPKYFIPESFGIAPELSEIICKCMRPDPNDRYQNDFDLLHDLKLALMDKYICKNDIEHMIDFTSHVTLQPSQPYSEQTMLLYTH